MPYRVSFPLLAALVVASGGFSPTLAQAANSYEELLRDVPNETNIIMLLNPQRAYASALARQENWSQQYQDRFRAGVTMLPPDARQAVIATDVNFNTLTRDFQIALVRVRQTETLQSIQSREGGTISQVAGRFALLSPRDAYVTPLNVTTMATMFPANRQALARWLRQVTAPNSTPAPLSPYLRKATDEWAERAEVVLAVDLADALDPGTIRTGLDSSLALSGRSANRDQLSRLAASAKGLTFAATIGSTIQATVKVEFGFDPQPFRDSIRELFLEALDTQGLPIPGMAQWPAVFDGSSMTLTGSLATQDLQRVINLFQFPSHHEAEAPAPAGGPAPMPGESPISPDQTRRFLTAIDQTLTSLKPPKEATTVQDAKAYTKAALDASKAAEHIEQLSRASVDPLAIEAGREVANRLRAIASSLNGVPVDLNIIQAGSYYNVSGGFPGWTGWGRWRVPFVAGRSMNTNIPQQNERMLRVIADDQKKRDELMAQVQSKMNDVKQKLVEKYGGKW